jgi:hypothetical protein
MSKEFFFYATKNDLLIGIQNFEETRPVDYIPVELYNDPNIPKYESINKYESLGINYSGNHQSELLLILDKGIRVNVRGVSQQRGGIKYAFDQSNNHTSIVFWPGGIYKNECLINGHVNTISDDRISLELYKEFRKKVTKGFKKIKGYYFGPEALDLYGKVRFVTTHIYQSEEYDFRID